MVVVVLRAVLSSLSVSVNFLLEEDEGGEGLLVRFMMPGWK